MGGAKLELDLNNMLPIEIEIKEDNTFQAAIGLSFKDKLTKAYYEKIKDAVQNYKRGDEDAAEDLLNAFKRDGNVDVKKSACKFAFSCDVEVLGYMEGSIYLKEDGSIAVSYTHLDVYKRQVLGFTAASEAKSLTLGSRSPILYLPLMISCRIVSAICV